MQAPAHVRTRTGLCWPFARSLRSLASIAASTRCSNSDPGHNGANDHGDTQTSAATDAPLSGNVGALDHDAHTQFRADRRPQRRDTHPWEHAGTRLSGCRSLLRTCSKWVLANHVRASTV